MEDSAIRELLACDISFEQAINADVDGDTDAEDCLLVPVKTPIKTRPGAELPQAVSLDVGLPVSDEQGI